MSSVIMKNGYWHVILLRVMLEILQILLYNSYMLICHQLPKKSNLEFFENNNSPFIFIVK